MAYVVSMAEIEPLRIYKLSTYILSQAVHSQQEPRLSLADFLCAKPGCMQLLQDPVVLNCGCCVCSACRPPLGGSCPRCGALSVTAAFGCSKVRLFPDQRMLQAFTAEVQRRSLQECSADL